MRILVVITCSNSRIEKPEQCVNLFKVNNKKIQTPERRQWRRFSIFIINFQEISHIVRMFPYVYAS